MVIAEDEWWERKIKENKAYGKYRYKGMKFAREMQVIFRDVLASGEDEVCPSREDEDDVYRPQIDLEEGSGDSEEELEGANTGGSVQVPSDLEGMNLTSNTQPGAPSGSASIGKRKRSEGATGSKKKKTSSQKQLVDSAML
ncbi:hypothetical protein K1719_013970 [Acacia pycnantha]|nr:hypothetical protein K1719_013970 [Acacia pycnantha]